MDSIAGTLLAATNGTQPAVALALMERIMSLLVPHFFEEEMVAAERELATAATTTSYIHRGGIFSNAGRAADESGSQTHEGSHPPVKAATIHDDPTNRQSRRSRSSHPPRTHAVHSLSAQLALFDRLLLFVDPLLAAHLASVECRSDVFAISWFMTLFAHTLPVERTFVIWDAVFLVLDPVYVVVLGVVLCQILRLELLHGDFACCVSTLLSAGGGAQVAKVDPLLWVKTADNLYYGDLLRRCNEKGSGGRGGGGTVRDGLVGPWWALSPCASRSSYVAQEQHQTPSRIPLDRYVPTLQRYAGLRPSCLSDVKGGQGQMEARNPSATAPCAADGPNDDSDVIMDALQQMVPVIIVSLPAVFGMGKDGAHDGLDRLQFTPTMTATATVVNGSGRSLPPTTSGRDVILVTAVPWSLLMAPRKRVMSHHTSVTPLSLSRRRGGVHETLLDGLAPSSHKAHVSMDRVRSSLPRIRIHAAMAGLVAADGDIIRHAGMSASVGNNAATVAAATLRPQAMPPTESTAAGSMSRRRERQGGFRGDGSGGFLGESYNDIVTDLRGGDASTSSDESERGIHDEYVDMGGWEGAPSTTATHSTGRRDVRWMPNILGAVAVFPDDEEAAPFGDKGPAAAASVLENPPGALLRSSAASSVSSMASSFERVAMPVSSPSLREMITAAVKSAAHLSTQELAVGAAVLGRAVPASVCHMSVLRHSVVTSEEFARAHRPSKSSVDQLPHHLPTTHQKQVGSCGPLVIVVPCPKIGPLDGAGECDQKGEAAYRWAATVSVAKTLAFELGIRSVAIGAAAPVARGGNTSMTHERSESDAMAAAYCVGIDRFFASQL